MKLTIAMTIIAGIHTSALAVYVLQCHAVSKLGRFLRHSVLVSHMLATKRFTVAKMTF